LCVASARSGAFKRWTLAVVVFAVATDIGLLLVGASVGGIRQRLLVAAGCAWQASLVWVQARAPITP
jgi:hypothetical protein